MRSFKRIFPPLLFLVILVFFAPPIVTQKLKGYSLTVFEYPLLSVYRNLGQLRHRIVSFFQIKNILKENQYLIEENRRFRAENLQIVELRKENDLLRKELGVAEKKGYTLEMARISQLSLDGPFRTALINKGEKDGLKAGQAAIFHGDILVGVVKEVYPNSALVFLLSDPRVIINVKVVESDISARARGALDDGLKLELVTNQEEIKEGQTVITNGLDGLPDLLIAGRVSVVRTPSGELFKTVKVTPTFGDWLLEDIFIIK